MATDHKGEFPDTPEALKKLPGIGDYTAAAIAAMAFNVSSPVVDGNVERVIARLFAVEESLPAVKPYLKELAKPFFEAGFKRPGDLAQGFMDLGAMVCIPANPRCGICPVSEYCEAYDKGIQAELPRRSPKKTKPQKTGHVYLIRDDARNVLLERRAEKAMMGGMSAFPTSEWVEKGRKANHPAFINLDKVSAKAPFIRHSFTHFDLQLTLHQGAISDATPPPDNFYWISADDILHQGFPTLFKKALKIWHDELIALPTRKAL
ncbi:MAG: NUDIX domain-containing protein [Alphaproteobacteria bacterium]|nr:NUDIX domain-containing protein [Alphaproteobacteria bacterium]